VEKIALAPYLHLKKYTINNDVIKVNQENSELFNLSNKL